MPDKNLDRLRSILTGTVKDDDSTLDHYSRDASLFTIKPRAVVVPQDAVDLARLVKFVSDHPHPKLTLTARSGGTDMTGGPLSDSLVVDFKNFNKIISVADAHATVQPGVYYRDLEKATLKHNWLLPSYPASRELCTVGGMVANNAGGEKTLLYGKTARYVKQLKVILSDGQEYIVKPLNKSELDQKMAEPGLFGQIHKQLFDLLDKNFDLIQRAKPNVSKNSAGYALWDVWNRKTGIFDLTQLFVGSQGTLGLITEITFQLVTPRPHRRLLVMFLDDTRQLSQIIAAVLAGQPESFESYDDHTLKLALKFIPDIIKRLPTKNWLLLAWHFLPEVKMILTNGVPKLVLLAEFSGTDPAEILARARQVKDKLARFKAKTRLITSPAEAEKYWVMRRESFNILRQHVDGKRTAPFIDDIIVRPDQLPEFLPRLDHIMAGYSLTYTIAGHMGDANFHIIPLVDATRPDLPDIIENLSRKVYDLIKEFNGSITAEHNDGLIRTPFLAQMYGLDIVELFRKVKTIFDPHDIFNPCKKVSAAGLPCGWRYAAEHLIKRN